jgi:ATP-dependent Lon protease
MATEGVRTYPSELPVLALRQTVVFPLTLQPLAISRAMSIESVNRALAGDRLLFLALQSDDKDEPDPGDLRTVGTVAAIRQMAKVANGIHVIVEGVMRGRSEAVTRTGVGLRATVSAAPDVVERTIEVDAYVRRLQELIDRAVSLASGLSQELRGLVAGIDEPLRLVYLLASLLDIKADEKQRILEETSLTAKLQSVANALGREIELLEMKNKIESAAQQEMTDAQRQYYLRQQLKAIQDELGEGEKTEIAELRGRLTAAHLPESVAKVAERELERLARMTPASPEYQMIRTYFDWVLDVPWSTVTEDHLDPIAARKALDEDHYDLDKVKDRIVEYLAVQKLKTQRTGTAQIKGPILCFVGPPGVGKTSLGQSIARAMNRKFVRISLGGVRDEAEIRGHRRTYIGAIPGRFVQALKQAGAMNPVFMLDEIDKVTSGGFQGDPAAALLDRMEIISLAGYTEDEKLHIARRYLIPRQLEENGLTPDMVTIDDAAIRRMVAQYTREAGVRNLERQIGAVARKVAARVAGAAPVPVAAGESSGGPTVVDAPDLPDYLGPPRIHDEVSFRVSRPGVATGVAWTEAGGDVLFVEAGLLPGGHGNIILTGQLGNVMQESARAALSHIRSTTESLGVSADFLNSHDLHIHVPAGAIPKDGPSAGVTMATAIVSALKNQTVREDVAMTGEITLSGLVLPVGGIREKALAARRHGIKTFILPARNEPDLAELAADVKHAMRFIPVETLEQVLAAALPTANR